MRWAVVVEHQVDRVRGRADENDLEGGVVGRVCERPEQVCFRAGPRTSQPLHETTSDSLHVVVGDLLGLEYVDHACESYLRQKGHQRLTQISRRVHYEIERLRLERYARTAL